MPTSQITKEQFVKWSFERDQKVGLYQKSMKLDTIPVEHKESYEEEADFYLSSKCPIGLPDDIIVRAKREGVEINVRR